VSGHIQDRWNRRGRFGDPGPTARNGKGLRWRVQYSDLSGRQRNKSFARRADAEQFLTLVQRRQVRSELLAADRDGFDPAGYYVYLLWEMPDDPAPLYVGKSGNILTRLGIHLSDADKRARIGWVSLVRCTSEQAMDRREAQLIRRYRPEWNRLIYLDDGRREYTGRPVRQPDLDKDQDWQNLKDDIRRATVRARAKHGAAS
jgi:GIY-YIG catalytic domain